MTQTSPVAGNLLFDASTLWSKNGETPAIIVGEPIATPNYQNLFWIRMKTSTSSLTFGGLVGVSQFLYPTATADTDDPEMDPSQSWHFHTAPNGAAGAGDTVHPRLVVTNRASQLWIRHPLPPTGWLLLI